MFYIVIAAWIAGVITSFKLENRKLPISILLIGLILTVVQFTVGIGYLYIALMAILAVIIWISNQMELS